VTDYGNYRTTPSLKDANSVNGGNLCVSATKSGGTTQRSPITRPIIDEQYSEVEEACVQVFERTAARRCQNSTWTQ